MSCASRAGPRLQVLTLVAGTYLYVGTSAHEILHLVSIPSTPNPENPKPAYILATRIQPLAGSHAAGSSPFIKNILVLPTVSKALVLSSTGLLTFYTLPEFSPAFSNQKLNNVSFIGGLDLNEEKGPGEEQPDKKGKLIMVLTKKIRMIRISDQVRLVNVNDPGRDGAVDGRLT